MVAIMTSGINEVRESFEGHEVGVSIIHWWGF